MTKDGIERVDSQKMLTYEEMRAEVLRHYEVALERVSVPNGLMKDVDWWYAQSCLACALGLITCQEQKQMRDNLLKAWKRFNTSKIYSELYKDDGVKASFTEKETLEMQSEEWRQLESFERRNEIEEGLDENYGRYRKSKVR